MEGLTIPVSYTHLDVYKRQRYGDRRTMFLRLLDDGLNRKVPEPERERYRERLDEEVYIICLLYTSRCV